jgi:hypothetical protein
MLMLKKLGELLEKYLKYIMGTFDKIWNEFIKCEMPQNTLKMMQSNIFHCLKKI